MAPMIGLIIAVDLRPVDRLRGVPGVPDGRGPRARHVHRRGHPDRYRHHRPPDHRRRAGPGRRRRRVRVLRPGDDEVPGVRPADRAAAGRHRGPDVPGARGDEAARRRLLVGADVDEAPAGTRSASARPTCPTSASGPPSAIRTDALVGRGRTAAAAAAAAARPDPSRRRGLVTARRRDDADPDRARPRDRTVCGGHHPHADTASGPGRRAADHPDPDRQPQAPKRR